MVSAKLDLLKRLFKYCASMVVFCAFCIGAANAQTVIDTSRTADFMVKKVLLGNGVLVGDVKYTGEKHAISIYEDSTSQVGISKGILLTSGNAYYAVGPNKTPRSGWASFAPGDEELEAIARGKTWDASVLEFDFVTISENLSFRYVFASEEYLEYVGSKFNDVFGFFVSGPNMTKTNIARLPDGVTPITVNTVNSGLNSEFYIDNAYYNTTDPYIWDVRNRKVILNKKYLQEEVPPKYDTQFDGFTTVLTAHYKVIPNQVYHIKLAIADVGDDILDSGVFLEAGSFQSSGEIVVELAEHFKRNDFAQKVQSKKTEIIPEYELKEIKIPKKTLLGQIEFEFDKYSITSEARSAIVSMFNEWKAAKNAKLELIGHTDDWGSHVYNEELSENRSKAVAQILLDLGVPKNLMVINFHGETLPIGNNDTEHGRARNRRVEFFLVN
ncbi:OmpA family protein [Fulvivirga lutimaris]|nr:OmpA family protein [Fulvivirga lutimaris]